MSLSGIFRAWRRDCAFHYNGRSVRTRGVVLSLLNPSLVGVLIFRVSAGGPPILRTFARWVAISVFSSDVSYGARFEGAFEVPHPVGIVIGEGAVIGERVKVYQGVTLGTEPRGGYPKIGSGSVIYAGAVIAGDVEVGENCKVGANVLLRRNLVSGSSYASSKFKE